MAAQTAETFKLSVTTTANTLTNARFSAAMADAGNWRQLPPTELAQLPTVLFENQGGSDEVHYSVGIPDAFEPTGTLINTKELFGTDLKPERASEHHFEMRGIGTAFGAALLLEATLPWLRASNEKIYRFEIPKSS